jgi:hypothetical protein
LTGHEKRVEALLAELVAVTRDGLDEVASTMPTMPDLGSIESRLLRIEEFVWAICDALVPDTENTDGEPA